VQKYAIRSLLQKVMRKSLTQFQSPS